MTFDSGLWVLHQVCQDHGPSVQESRLEFAGGRLLGAGQTSLEGTYDPATGACSFRVLLDNESIEQWDGLADGGAIRGFFEDVVPSRRRRGACRGSFRMVRKGP